MLCIRSALALLVAVASDEHTVDSATKRYLLEDELVVTEWQRGHERISQFLDRMDKQIEAWWRAGPPPKRPTAAAKKGGKGQGKPEDWVKSLCNLAAHRLMLVQDLTCCRSLDQVIAMPRSPPHQGGPEEALIFFFG